ncbi:MAG: GNAT family N-acetyltransferase [Candidatus Omnitrophica bacterium]|nr:GNAT family N-acetyltransferase [Candidatus Omnitrophota bacterium]
MTGFIEGKKVFLRKLSMDDATGNYLLWLNDPDVLRYRGPKAYPSNFDDLRDFIKNAQTSKDLFLAICLKSSGKHIGGISLTSVNFIHRTAELSIMIGEKSEWGKGYARDSIEALTRHAFTNMNLNKLWAESPSPAFNAAVRKLGWVHEGTKRKSFLLDGEYVDVECYGLLKSDFISSKDR